MPEAKACSMQMAVRSCRDLRLVRSRLLMAFLLKTKAAGSRSSSSLDVPGDKPYLSRFCAISPCHQREKSGSRIQMLRVLLTEMIKMIKAVFWPM